MSLPVTVKSGRKVDKVWDFFIKSSEKSYGHYSANCMYCNYHRKKAYVHELQAHLANNCTKCPGEIRDYYLNLLSEDGDETSSRSRTSFDSNSTVNKRKRVGNDNQKGIDDYFDNIVLPESKIQIINKALIRAFVCGGISFRVVDNPFFKEFLYQLRSNYSPPTRQLLSGQLLSKEIARVNVAIHEELKNAEHLTIGKYILILLFTSDVLRYANIILILIRLFLISIRLGWLDVTRLTIHILLFNHDFRT